MNEQCPLSDEQLDALDTFALHCLAPRQRESVREYGRAVATAAVEAERTRREGEDFENSLESHHRAELGLRPKLPKGYHYYVAHPLTQVEIRKDDPAIPAAQERAEAAEAEVKMLRGFSELWYFVMDEKPMEFERIVTTCVPAVWMDEAAKLRKATHG